MNAKTSRRKAERVRSQINKLLDEIKWPPGDTVDRVRELIESHQRLLHRYIS